MLVLTKDDSTRVISMAFSLTNLRGETVYPVAAKLIEGNAPFAFVSGCAQGDIDLQFQTVPLLLKPVKPMMVEKMLKRFRNG